MDLASFVLFASGDLDGTIEIQPCRGCDSWHVEVQPQDAQVVVREWHAADCPDLRTLLADDE